MPHLWVSQTVAPQEPQPWSSPLCVPQIHPSGHLSATLFDTPAGTPVPRPWQVNRCTHPKCTPDSGCSHWYTPSPSPYTHQHAHPTRAPTLPSLGRTRGYTRSPAPPEVAAVSVRLGASPCGPAARVQTSKRTKTGRASRREGAEPPVSSSLAMLVCLGSAATASSGSDCRVNHQADLNNYRLLKKKGGG